MAEILTAQQVNDYMTLLNEKQKEFLEQKIKRKKKSKWLETLAKYKGVPLEENLTYEEAAEKINDWILIEILDGGFGNRPYRCECGTSLRFQYIVEHNTENKTYYLGSTCFEHYTGLPSEVINDIKNNLYNIDLERDELLLKYYRKSFFDLRPIIEMKIEIPEEIHQQWETGLPLSDKQIEIIYKLKTEEEKRRRLENLLSKFSTKQKDYLSRLPKKDLVEILEKKERWLEYSVEDIESLKVSERTKFHYQLRLPLLDNQIKEIRMARAQKVREDMLKRAAESVESMTGTWKFDDNTETIDNYEQRMVSVDIDTKSLDFDILMERHLNTLKRVREKEDKIPRGLLNDWNRIKQMSVDLKNGKEFDYGTFKLLLNNLIIPLRVEKDLYL